MSHESSTPKVWRYSVPSIKDEGWAILFVDDRGCFAALSDYGNWSYRWNTAGLPDKEGMREVLLGCHDEYLLRKLSPEKVYDEDGTIENFKGMLIEWRRLGQVRDKAKARERKAKVRELWDRLVDGIEDEEEAYSWASRAGSRFSDDLHESIHTVHEYRAVAFVERCWPRLRQCIVDELAAEKARVAS